MGLWANQTDFELTPVDETEPLPHNSYNSASNLFCLTDINFQGLSDYENSTTRTTPTSAFASIYSARSYEQFDLIYLSLFAKLQNSYEGKSF